MSFLLCVGPRDADYALQEVYEGICRDHIGARILDHKILRWGYYWLTMNKDAKDFVKKCPKCQLFALVPHQSLEELTPILSSILFVVWGINLLGPLPLGNG